MASSASEVASPAPARAKPAAGLEPFKLGKSSGSGKNPVVPAPGKSVLAKNVIAIVIGNRDYERGTSPVSYALNDAAAFRATLERSFGLDPKDIWYSENLGLADFLSLFGSAEDYKRSRVYRTASMRESPTDLVIYYSGHGAPSTSGATKGKGYLVPVDADLLAIQSTGYSIDELLQNVASMKAEKVIGRSWICFDACFSGQGGDGGLLIKNVSGIAVKPVAPKARIAESVVMFASSGEEFASWYPEEKHGLFTYFLLKGLAGEADENGDRSIAIPELESYLRKWVPRYANGLNAQEQTPQVLAAGDIPGFLSLRK
ncbi:MAG TPA: caspase family protein [Spirochaetales bacterium]|nr:caspase family protein [Spirochaetales bacterium]